MNFVNSCLTLSEAADHFSETAHSLAEKRGHNLNVRVSVVFHVYGDIDINTRNAWLFDAPANFESRVFLRFIRPVPGFSDSHRRPTHGDGTRCF